MLLPLILGVSLETKLTQLKPYMSAVAAFSPDFQETSCSAREFYKWTRPLHIYKPSIAYLFLLLSGITLRPERPASLPDSRTRIQQIHIPLIIPPPPSSPRNPPIPSHPEQPSTHTIKVSPPRPPSSPQQPGQPAGLPEAPIRPVVETGEAGPPGYIRRVTVRRGSEDSSSVPLKGFAGAPGKKCCQIRWSLGYLGEDNMIAEMLSSDMNIVLNFISF